MKSIYLANNQSQIDYVYSDEIMDKLINVANLCKGDRYTKNDVLTNPEKFADVEYIFSTWSMPAMTEEEIEKCFPALKAIFYSAGSVQTFARPFMSRGVKIFSAWAANAVPVAEYTVAQIILSCKGFFKSCTLATQNKRKEAQQHSLSCPGNYGCKVGLIGVGMIGSLVAEMLKVYNHKILVFDPFCSQEKADKLGVELCSLERIFSECQVISNHLANNPQTVGMLNYDLFKLMRPTATFLNTGRGAQVVEADLAKALSEKPDAVAVLDVTFPEPIQEGNPLLALGNVYLTPHIAGSQADEVHRMAEYMIEEFKSFTEGNPTRYEVSEKMLETMA